MIYGYIIEFKKIDADWKWKWENYFNRKVYMTEKIAQESLSQLQKISFFKDKYEWRIKPLYDIDSSIIEKMLEKLDEHLQMVNPIQLGIFKIKLGKSIDKEYKKAAIKVVINSLKCGGENIKNLNPDAE
jgi:hypothetical protein